VNTNTFEDIKFHTRISQVFKRKGIKQSDLVKKYHFPAAKISKYFNETKTITKTIAKLLHNENINIDWICTGRGDMFLEEQYQNMKFNENIEYFSRISEFFQKKGIEQREIVRKYEFLSVGLTSNFFNINKSITDRLAKLCFYENLNVHWICTGIGESNIKTLNFDKKLEEKKEDFCEKIYDILKKQPLNKQKYY
jgi:transcriptional regulator with XRE-family HTH domain